MKKGKPDKEKRLESAALVKYKYHELTGCYDNGFKKIFAGVLRDLQLEEKEVDDYLQKNRARLQKICEKK